MIKAAILIPILALGAAAQTSAQTSTQTSQSKWEAMKILSQGIEVRVAASNAKPVQGALDAVTDSALVLKQAGGARSFDRSQILSVSVKGKEHRLRNAMIGLGVGTAIGMGIGYGVGRAQSNNCTSKGGWFCNLDTGAGFAVGGISGLVGGTLTGVFWHTGGWRKIYTP